MFLNNITIKNKLSFEHSCRFYDLKVVNLYDGMFFKNTKK